MQVRKKLFYTEAAYVVGLMILAVGTALMECADFGMSMIVAPAYIMHMKISQFLPFFSFGMAEYVFQAILIMLLMLICRRAKFAYLVSFGTAVVYGFMLDRVIGVLSQFNIAAMGVRLACYFGGFLLCAVAIALLFTTYISPEAYEVFVKEISDKFGLPLGVCKTVYDCSSCVLAVLMSFLFFGFGQFEGIGWGTALSALLNGTLISLATKGLHHLFDFRDGLSWRRYFEKKTDRGMGASL